jgi:hypothetical protein
LRPTGIELLHRGWSTGLLLHQVGADRVARAGAKRTGANWTDAGDISDLLKRKLLGGQLLHRQVTPHCDAGSRTERPSTNGTALILPYHLDRDLRGSLLDHQVSPNVLTAAWS